LLVPPQEVRPGLPAGIEFHPRCARCAKSKCCRQISIQVDTPTAREDFQNLLWFVAHRGVAIFADEGDWFVSIETSCGFLEENGLCGIYEFRPPICSDYSAEECDRDDDTQYELLFESYEELYAYVMVRFPAFPAPTRELLPRAYEHPGGAADVRWLRRASGSPRGVART
jgi:Fe-S-cluster containining protein